MLNTVSLATNLSYYGNPGTGGGNGSVWTMKLGLTDALQSVLLHDNEEAVIEAARAFGNLSRDAEVRARMSESRVDEALCVLLDHSNREIVFTVCGVIMNIASDERNREATLAALRGYLHVASVESNDTEANVGQRVASAVDQSR